MTALSAIFEQGIVYADKWPAEVRTALDVPDPLTTQVTEGLAAGKVVVITGNAGDGKSHLAQQALSKLPNRSCVEIEPDTVLPQEPGHEYVVFVRDASALPDEVLLRTVETVSQFNLPMLITINEGPLASLAERTTGGFFRAIREVLHHRAQGYTAEDPARTILINLAGRQLVRADFGRRVLELVIANVVPCGTCGKSKSCPRVYGANLLRRSKRAKERVPRLLQLLASGGRHLTARDIWVFFIELFYGHVCQSNDPAENIDGYFWNRIFDDDSSLAYALHAEFDPIRVPMPSADIALWLGDFESVEIGTAYPGPSPVATYRESDIDGMRAFTSAKRAYYLFAKDVDVDAVVSQSSLAPQFKELLEGSFVEPRAVTRNLIALLNNYRISTTTETELWVSRHHGMAAHKRASSLAASAKASLDQIELLVPHKHDAERFPESGYFPDALYLKWSKKAPTFTVDFTTWSELQKRRTLAVDRLQETLDFAIDLFMAQAPIPNDPDPEIRVFDHRERRTYLFRVRHGERGFEVLS